MIEVKDLVKKYGDHVAVDHLSFTIEKGKIYGFLGPNGAGKSTTMNMITGYIASTQGEILIDGHNILEEPEAAIFFWNKNFKKSGKPQKNVSVICRSYLRFIRT